LGRRQLLPPTIGLVFTHNLPPSLTASGHSPRQRTVQAGVALREKTRNRLSLMEFFAAYTCA
jgi:hypothetical protein